MQAIKLNGGIPATKSPKSACSVRSVPLDGFYLVWGKKSVAIGKEMILGLKASPELLGARGILQRQLPVQRPFHKRVVLLTRLMSLINNLPGSVNNPGVILSNMNIATMANR